MKTITHQFGPGDTVQGIIRKYNRHDMPQEFVEMLTEEFNKVNSDKNRVPRVGESFTIPIYTFTEEDLKKFPSEQPRPPQPVKRSTPKPKLPIGDTVVPELQNIISMEDQGYLQSDELKAILIRQERRQKAKKAVEEGKPLPIYHKRSTEIKSKPKLKIEENKPKAPKKVAPKKKSPPKKEREAEEKIEEPVEKRRTKPKKIVKTTPREEIKIFHRRRPRT